MTDQLKKFPKLSNKFRMNEKGSSTEENNITGLVPSETAYAESADPNLLPECQRTSSELLEKPSHLAPFRSKRCHNIAETGKS
jgi:hypothetical protein